MSDCNVPYEPFGLPRTISSSRAPLPRRPVEVLRECIERRDIVAAQDALSKLKNIVTDDWSSILKTFAYKFLPWTTDPAQSLFLGLLAIGDDDRRFDLVVYIIRITSDMTEPDDMAVHFEITQGLLSRYPALPAHIKQSKNLFHYAAESGASRIIEMAMAFMNERSLLQSALALKDKGGDTPLAIAVKKNALNAVTALTENGRVQNITPSVLGNSLTADHFEVLQVLVGERSTLVTLELLETTIQHGDIQTWEYLISKVQPQSIQKSDLLQDAVTKRRLDIVQSLVNKCPDLVLWRNEQDQCILFYNKPQQREDPELQQQIRDIIVPKIIEKCEPKEIRSFLNDSAGNRREIGLDLSVLQNSPKDLARFHELVKAEIKRSKSFQSIPIEDDLPPIGIQFEPCLRNVIIPTFPSHPSEFTHLNVSICRKEVEDILNWLQLQNVSRILSLEVSDSFHNPHTEEIIELSVAPFGVETLDWRRLDLSIDCVQNAAPDVKNLFLYSSGNWAALSHWTGCEGLSMLAQLETVQIKISTDFIGQKRATEYMTRTREKLTQLKLAIDAGWTFHVSIWSWGTPQPASHQMNSEGTKTAPAAAFRIGPFLESFDSFKRRPSPPFTQDSLEKCRTKIAIIDNGVQLAALTCSRVTGASFVYHDGKESPWWLARELHGTQMANIVHELDSECELFIAKIGESKSDVGYDRVIEAINWAIRKNVDIISMSLVLFKSGDTLISAIEQATGAKDIVMLCSTADDGNNYQKVWPAEHRDTLGIAACNAFGKLTQWSTATDSNFEVQGEHILTSIYCDDELRTSRVQASGSSVATAIAAGIASLVLSCYRMYEFSRVGAPKRAERRRNVVVKNIFGKRMVEGDSIYVQPSLFFKTADGKPMGSSRNFVAWLRENYNDI